MRVLITGSRDWADAALIRDVLDKLLAEQGNLTVVHGVARGADTIADRWATERGDEGRDIQQEHHPVIGLEWGRYGKSAGHRRNAEMVARGADLCLAFIRDASPGATGCARLAEAAGIPVHRYEQNGDRPAMLRQMTQDSLDLGLYDVTINDGGH